MVYRLSFGICSLNLAVVLVAIVANQTVENSDNEAIVCSFLTPFQCSTQVQVPIRQVLSACFGHLIRQQNNHSHYQKNEVMFIYMFICTICILFWMGPMLMISCVLEYKIVVTVHKNDEY